MTLRQGHAADGRERQGAVGRGGARAAAFAVQQTADPLDEGSRTGYREAAAGTGTRG
ncbi:hypothetical protein ACIQVT_30255 [Streptomyces sp. NPDC100445]|uniref:hypothetical protein n=1 Tax=Streptomyces sp. NPDC100445 TaxID=3366102 RepID=UPI00380B5ABE